MIPPAMVMAPIESPYAGPGADGTSGKLSRLVPRDMPARCQNARMS